MGRAGGQVLGEVRQRILIINHMRKTIALAVSLFAFTALSAQYPVDPVPFTSVKVTDDFWGLRLKASREVTIPLAFSKCEETGRYDNFSNAAAQMQADHNLGFKPSGFPFDDTDVYKTIEGASYILQTYPDAKLESYIDSVLVIVASAQEPDGYLYTPRTMNPVAPHSWSGPERWAWVEDGSHELYNLGHMVDAAVAHYQATGKRNFLDIAMKYADCVCRELGDGEGQQAKVPGHQIAEMALARLYTVTGEKKYLDQAKYFLDKRGHTISGPEHEYNQAHKPVVEQDEAVGHAVRAGYMYAGMADVAALTGDNSYIEAIDRIWDNIVSQKLYLTGGVGSTSRNEGYEKGYILPNETAYCETCASIANVYMNYRMFLMHGESKYFDVLERSLYNGVISGVSLEGDGFFYPNPLASSGQHKRQPWFGCACCPSNICRFIPSIPGYVYAVKGNNLYVNLYMSNTLEQNIGGKAVTLSQKTGYPWNGDICVSIDRTAQKKAFAIKLRIPGWVTSGPVPSDLYSYADDVKPGYSVKVNGLPAEGSLGEDGYFTVERKWKKGDEITLHLDMEPRIVKANDKVAADRGRIAVERGPIVYCAEWPDNDFDLKAFVVNQNPKFKTYGSDELYGIQKITTDAQSLGFDAGGKLVTRDVTLTLIPYYSWCHRGSGNMTVWLPQSIGAIGQ